MKYYIECSSFLVTYTESDPEDDWDHGYDGYEGHAFEVSTKKLAFPDATFETDIESPHFIAVIYSTGCTFGRTDGYVQYLGPYTKEDALKYAKILEDSSGEDYELIETPKNWYPCWTGFFEHYQHCEVIC